MAGYRILFIHTHFCGDCRATLPSVEKVCAERGVELACIDPTEPGNDGVIELWGLRKVPTMIAVRVREGSSDEIEIDRLTGRASLSAVEVFFDKVESLLKG